MKLNTKKTVEVGFAFLSICAFWQMYDSIVPLLLTKTFHLNETVSGAIMAMDNVLALFLLPIFGGISDRSKFKMGKRKPFILFGTIAAVILMILIPMIDNSYFENPTFAKQVLFVGVLGALLVAMGTYRSPAVALMPDVTPKPLRSKANAVINLMGALGGVIYLIVASVLYSSSKTAGLEHVNYMPLFLIVAGIMLAGMCIVMITVDEVQLNKEMRQYEQAHPEENLAKQDDSGGEELPAPVKRSLIFLLISISLWFIAYNGLTTWFTTFSNKMWNMSLGDASQCMTVATVGAIISYIPIGNIAGKVGRKKTILTGIVMLFSCFIFGCIYTMVSHEFSPLLYILFALVGIGWAAINVNSLPMVVEMCKGSDIGKFTGYYYTFSMAAQIVTPIVAGWLLSNVGYQALFPYAAAFAALAFITMSQVRHGDSKEGIKKGLEAFDVDD